MSLSQAVAALCCTPRTLDAGPSTAWQRCLVELLGTNETDELLRGEWASPEFVAAQPLETLLELLARVPRGPQKAGVIHKFATWWHGEFGDAADPEWPRPVEDYRAALRALRGLGPETVDRLLLFGPGLRVAPVDRGTLRIAVRHGWLDLPVSDEDAQATFLSGLGESTDELRDGIRRLQDIGSRFCGRVPDCEPCPLKAWLPPGGPLSPDAC